MWHIKDRSTLYTLYWTVQGPTCLIPILSGSFCSLVKEPISVIGYSLLVISTNFSNNKERITNNSVVDPGGVEPPTSSLQMKRSTR